MSVFIFTTDARLSEQNEHKLLKNKNVIRITAASFLIRNCESAEGAASIIAPSDKDKEGMKPWYIFQVSKPWQAQGAEQNWKLTQQKTIGFLRAYAEDTPNANDNDLENFSDEELDIIAESPDV